VGRSEENTGFVCEHCGRAVRAATNGSYRNHCPFCLFSKHVDVAPGDRASHCGGLMAPVALRRSSKGFQIVHRCVRCGAVRLNKVAERTQQPDDIDAIITLMYPDMQSK
jgi:hypothetical protein